MSDLPAHAAVRARLGGSPVPFRLGAWSAVVRGDEVADVAYDGVPLLRAIRPVVRDADWNTVPVHVVAQELRPSGMIIGLHVEQAEIRYGATIRLSADRTSLTVELAGAARSAFRSNRIGLVVLHPAGDAGRQVEVRHTDDRRDAGVWPVEISPHQPFRDVAGFAWSRDGVAATLELRGDVFETEDQRNWTDASYKTYSTPLDRPFPVDVDVGDQVRQSVRLTAAGHRTTAPDPEPEGIDVAPLVVGRVPPISLGAALRPAPDVTVLAGLGRSYGAVLVELTGDPVRWPVLLASAAAQAAALDVALDVRVVTDDPAVLDRTVAALADHRVTRVAAYAATSHRTTPELWTALQTSVARHGVDAELVGGTRAHFTELNRQHGDLPVDLPALTFSLTPQMHATEVPHLVDSLATQRTVITNARRIAAGRLLHVGPITLRPRFNAVATGPRPGPSVEAEGATDPLQGTDFAAAWTLASVAALTVPGAAGLSYYETVGARGVVDEAGVVTPAGHVLDTVAGWRGRPVLDATAPAGTAVLAVSADRPGHDHGAELLIADLTGTDRTLPLTMNRREAEWLRLPAWSVVHRVR